MELTISFPFQGFPYRHNSVHDHGLLLRRHGVWRQAQLCAIDRERSATMLWVGRAAS